jgi:hypothetical protein
MQASSLSSPSSLAAATALALATACTTTCTEPELRHTRRRGMCICMSSDLRSAWAIASIPSRPCSPDAPSSGIACHARARSHTSSTSEQPRSGDTEEAAATSAMAVAAGARALPPTTHRVEAITQRGAAEAQPAHRDAGAGQRPAQHQRRRLLHARRSAAPACTQTANERPAHQLPAPRSCRRGRSGDGTHHQHLLLCWDVAHQLRQSGLGVLTQLRTGALPAQPLDAAATAAAAAAAAAAAPG